MNIRQLQIFKAICDAGSIVRAAEVERSAPSVLAHHLGNLEHRIGVPLLIRQSRGVTPNDAGKRLYAHATAILRAIQLAEQDMHESSSEITGEVAIGMAYSSVRAIGSSLMATVMRAHPKLRLTIAESLSGVTVERLLESEVDLAIAYNPSKDAQLQLTPLLEEKMVCIGRRDVIGDSPSPIRLDELTKMPYVLLRKGVQGRAVMDEARLQKLLEQNARLYTDSVHAAQLFLKGGLGCMIDSLANLNNLTGTKDLVSRPIIAPEIVRTLYLCELPDRPHSRAVQLIRELSLGMVKAEIEAGRWPCRSLLH
uniref:LysR family transcriptional regulator n=1 Tax=Marinobacterium profundum TaxID=1714300 RepID=UPI00082B7266|nr:LysR substrate-binding domain-containing protein [Marinobacterium profundum]